MELANFSECGARVSDDTRTATLTCTEKSANLHNLLSSSIGFTVRIISQRELIEFESQPISVTQNQITIALPENATISTSRRSLRIKAHFMKPQSALVKLIRCDGISNISEISVTDISSHGIGASIRYSGSPETLLGTEVVGLLLQSTGTIPLEGKIVWAKPTQVSNTIQLGISNKAQTPEHDAVTEPNRRSAKRSTIETVLEIISPIDPNYRSLIQVENISMTGFRARFRNRADSALFRTGLVAQILDPHLRARVVSMSADALSCTFSGGSIEERIKLFNNVSFQNQPDLATTTIALEDIPEIYGSSGAITSQLAQHLTSKAREWVTTNQNKWDSPWLLRWLQQNDQGRIRAAILTAPYAERVWYLGGLAAHMDPDLRLSADFISRYFCALAEFLRSLGTRENLLFNWIKGHPRWVQWDNYLESPSIKPLVSRFSGDIAYLKNYSEYNLTMQTKIAWEPIEVGDIAAVARARSSIGRPELLQLFEHFGLNGSASLGTSHADLFRRMDLVFHRQFYSLEMESLKAVVMLNNFPPAGFSNEVLNFPFLHINTLPSAMEIDRIVASILELCARNGFSPPALYITFNGSESKFLETELTSLKPAIWTFGSPQSLDFWADK